ncbi:hypothetical protein D9615_002054 [Tricholomella constricta]|uniref:DUF6534 domain-containing protein n=1 Tax=Tricholomella constricta TaxID=117010 RepID=A0A8H5HPX2_9AGAR|nr:hypothetical protein D9615_002054 [Tricholomella constricta]
MSTVNIVTFFAFPDTLIFLGSNFLFTKIYANALLANLNARESLRGRGYIKEGTITLNWSALRTNYNEVLVLNEPEDGTTDPSFSCELSQPSPIAVAVAMSNRNGTQETLEHPRTSLRIKV